MAVAGAATAGLFAVATLPTETLAGLLRRAGGGGGPLADAAGGAAEMRVRAALLGLFFLVVAAVAAAAGPHPIRRVLAGLPRLTAATLRPLASPWIAGCLGLLTALLAVRIGLHLDQTLRADEAQTFLRSGAGSPLFSMLVWTSPNNHILHSVLMRLSVMLFGTDPWAIRLPAAAITAATVPLVFLGLRRHLGVAASLLAAGVFAGSAYAVEQGTNARGYPIVVAATLVLAAVARACAAGRPAAVAVAAIAAAVGAWAVPVMLLPFAGLLVYVAWWNRRRPGVALRRSAALAAPTGVLALTLYAPALLLVTFAETGVASAAYDTMAETGILRQARIFGFDLAHAWAQMSFPAGSGTGWIGFALVLAGVLLAARRGHASRAFVVAALVGPLAIVLGFGVVPMPWWTLGFAFPVLAGFAAVPVARLLEHCAALPIRSAAALALPVAAVLAVAASLAGYPERYPWRLGYPDARPAAAAIAGLLGAENAPPLQLEVGPERGAVLAYHLREAGVPAAGPGGVVGTGAGAAEPWLLWIPPGRNEDPTDPALLARFTREPAERFSFAGSEALLLRPVEPLVAPPPR